MGGVFLEGVGTHFAPGHVSEEELKEQGKVEGESIEE